MDINVSNIKNVIGAFIEESKALSADHSGKETTGASADFFDVASSAGSDHFHDQLAVAIMGAKPAMISATLSALKEFSADDLYHHLLFPIAGSQDTAECWPLYAALIMYKDDTITEADALQKARVSGGMSRRNPHELLFDLLNKSETTASPQHAANTLNLG